MASKVSNVSKLIGHYRYEPGAHMYHAADSVVGGGKVNKEARHRMKKALYKHRLRATGMTDNLYGSKEMGGINENKLEYEEKNEREDGYEA